MPLTSRKRILLSTADAYSTQLHIQTYLDSILCYHRAASFVICMCIFWLVFIKPLLWFEEMASTSFFTYFSEYISLGMSFQKHAAGLDPSSSIVPVTDPLSSFPQLAFPMVLTSLSSCHDETNGLTIAFWSTNDQLDLSIKCTIRRYIITLIFILSILLLQRANAYEYIDLTQISLYQSKWSHFPHTIIWPLVACLGVNIFYIQCQMLPLLMMVICMDLMGVIWIIHQIEKIEYFKQVISKCFPRNLVSAEVSEQIVEETTARELQ